MTRATVLGAGMVGSAIAMDLARESGWHVTVVDRDADALDRVAAAWGVATACRDLSDAAAIAGAVDGQDVVLGALPSRMGYASARAVIQAGKPYVDISFMSEDATSLSALARERGVVAVVDCGIAPGISNMAAGWASKRMHPCERIEIYAGALPAERRWPLQFKAGYAPADVIEGYTRPARYVQGRKIVVDKALSDPELVDFAGIGTLEAFNTDGLRTLVSTLDVPFMIEKTLRYPGHIEVMRVLRDTGLFGREPIDVGGQKVVPLDVLSALLFPRWTYEEGEEDLTVMRVIARGVEKGRPKQYQWDLLDRYDAATKLRSTSRTTAFAATIMARFIVQGRFSRPGVHPPEIVGQQDGLFDAMLAELEQRGVRLVATVEDL